MGQLGHTEAGEATLPWQWEPARTRSWFDLLQLAVRALDAGGLLAVDLGSELHPLLTTELIRLFHEPGTNPHGAQLIFNSHDVGLVRVRDGLDDVEGRYLRGRYGAVPFLDHELLDLLEDVVSANPFRELPVVRQAS